MSDRQRQRQLDQTRCVWKALREEEAGFSREGLLAPSMGLTRTSARASFAVLICSWQISRTPWGSHPSLSARYAKGPFRGLLRIWRRERETQNSPLQATTQAFELIDLPVELT
jgi:hypothetical protein